MENWIQEALTQWQKSDVKVNPPATDEAIENVENALNFKFPEDFKSLYKVINGFEYCDWQEHMFSFWSLDRIINEADKQCVYFCDFLLSSSFIGFDRNKKGIFKIYRSFESEEFIAETFEDVVAMINSSNDLIY